jgi:hypothetical protein
MQISYQADQCPSRTFAAKEIGESAGKDAPLTRQSAAALREEIYCACVIWARRFFCQQASSCSVHTGFSLP